jgi:flagellar biosynthetic protein FliQ
MPLSVTLLHQAMIAELHALLPIVALLLIVGTVTATLQAAFQLEDTALSLLPKTIAMIIIAIFGGFGALTEFETLAMGWIRHAGMLVHRPWS